MVSGTIPADVAKKEKIVVLGASLSGMLIAYLLHRQNSEHEIFVIEQGAWGGVGVAPEVAGVSLESFENIIAEEANFFLPFLQIFLNEEQIYVSQEKLKKHISKDNILVKVPASATAMFFSPLAFILNKIKAISNYKKIIPQWSNVSIFDTLKNIGGENFSEAFASALARYYFSAEAEDVEFASCFEREFLQIKSQKSLKNAIASVRQETKEILKDYQEKNNSRNSKVQFVAVKNGKSALAKAIKEFLQKNAAGKVVFESQKVTRISYAHQKYQVQSRLQRYNDVDRIVSTLPPQEMATVLRDFDKELSHEFEKFQTTAQTVIYLNFDKKEFSFDGMGFVNPRKQKHNFLYAQNISNIFQTALSPQEFLMRVVVAGDMALFSDDEAQEMVLNNFRKFFKYEAKPLWCKVIRYNQTLPKYHKGHFELVKEIERRLSSYPNFHLLSRRYRGFSLSQEIINAHLLAQKILTS